MLRVDPATGKSTVLFTERSGPKSWVNLSDAYHPMRNGDLIWSSERDGFRHLYRFARGRWTQLTNGPWVVTDLIGVDEQRGLAYFAGTKDDVLEQHLYRLDLNRRGEPVRLTERGFHTTAGVMDKAATRLMVVRSGPAQPQQVYLADANGTRQRWLGENAVVRGHPYHPYLASHRPTEFGTLKAADGTTLHWEMITPPLEPGKRYPVFFEHYGGPGSQQVTRGWQGPLPQYLVDQGWIYFKLDNRGAINRGKAFEDQLFQAMGGVEVVDQLAGANYLKTLPFVAGDKIATYGWSYGGYMTLKMLQANPGVYAAGVAGAPVTDWRLYDTHYTERYMGDPRKVARAYDEAGAIKDAAKLRDPLLLIHGMADDNVFLSNTTLVAAEMQKTGTPFEMMLYPGYTHRVGGPEAGPHLWATILAFLDRHVKNAPAK
jgi:dipeptidyl-peptidase-4